MTKTTTESRNFLFDPKEHIYTLDGKKMTGVTSVLGVIAKPALIQWAANEAVKYVETWVKDKSGTDTSTFGGPQEFTTDLATLKVILEEARVAHRKKKQDAGSKGTDVHSQIEEIIKYAINETGGLIKEIYNENPQIMKFITWAKWNLVQFLSCEQQIYSETHWLGGTYDFICEIDGKKYVGDIKTSNAIYGREYFAQCAGYRLMLEEMGETGFAGSVVVRLGKDGGFEEKYSYDYETDRKLFLACLDVYRAMGTFDIK